MSAKMASRKPTSGRNRDFGREIVGRSQVAALERTMPDKPEIEQTSRGDSDSQQQQVRSSEDLFHVGRIDSYQ